MLGAVKDATALEHEIDGSLIARASRGIAAVQAGLSMPLRNRGSILQR